MRLFTRLMVGVAGAALASPALAQFAPGPDPVTTAITGQQTLSGGTGTVTSTGSISNSGGAAAVVISGSGTVLDNAGTIQQTGTGRAIDNTANNASLTITNSGRIRAVSTDAVRINTGNTSISLTNSGTISVSAGGQAIDWAAITTGSNTLINQFGGIIATVGEDAVRPGQNGVVTNSGIITATPTITAGAASGSDGIDLRTEKSVTVTNTGTISGRHGIATDGANVGPSSLTVNNNRGRIQALNGSGLNVDANTALPSAVNVTANVTNAAGATISGGVLATTTVADGDGIDIDGVLTLNNAGDVLGLGAKGGTNNAEGIAAGGGSITNTATGRIIGSTLAADAPEGDTSRAGNGILIDDSNGGNAVAATTLTNSGLVQGKSGFAVKMVGSFADTVTNNAGGTLQGAGGGAAVQTGDGADLVVNRGTILGEAGAAIDLGAGDDRLRVEGGSASIGGTIAGGAGSNKLTITAGTGQTFSYAGAISEFDEVEILDGTVNLLGESTYTGRTRLGGGVLALNGANRIAAESVLDLDGGLLKLLTGGQGFACLDLGGDAGIELGAGSLLTFGALCARADGAELDVTAEAGETVLRFLGDISNDAEFLALIAATRINGAAPTYAFDGRFTAVSAASPVPEPASLALLAGGIMGLALVRRRRAQ